MTTNEPIREIRDVFGRRRRVGESAESLLGHGRHRQLLAAWLGLAAISPLQYAVGLAVLLLPTTSPGLRYPMTSFAVFVVFQALTAIVVARLEQRTAVPASWTVATGCGLSALGLFSLSHATSPVLVLGGYGVLGGVGAGLVYAQCVATVARWYPDRHPRALGIATSGFAAGAVPVLVLLVMPGGGLGPAMGYGAVLAVLVGVVAGWELRDPPARWWPAEVDPQVWAVDRRLNRGIGHNMPAVREFSVAEARHDKTLRLMWAMLVLTSAVSLFGIAFVPGYVVASDLGLTAAGVAAGTIAAFNALGRVLGGRLSDDYGRERILVGVLVVEAVGQVGLAAFGPAGGPVVFILGAVLVGLGGGAFYVMFAELVLEYFGESAASQNQAVLYTAKAAGGVLGVGAGAVLVAGSGFRPGFLLAGCLGLATAQAVRLLRQPGRPAAPLSGAPRRRRFGVHRPLRP